MQTQIPASRLLRSSTSINVPWTKVRAMRRYGPQDFLGIRRTARKLAFVESRHGSHELIEAVKCKTASNVLCGNF